MRIPLLVSGPGVAPGRSGVPARGLDIAPTLLGLAGIARHGGMDGLDLLNDPVPAGRVRVVETYGGAVPNIPGVREMMEDQPPMRQGVYAGGWKLIADGDTPELYHLPDDPMEERDRAGEHPEKVVELRALLDDWNETTPRINTEPHELSEEDIRALEAGGYL
jgi:arylsulfatase A-like enzyme